MEICVQDLKIEVKLGYFAQERLKPQEVIVNLKVGLFDELQAGVYDELERTVDYAELVVCVHEALDQQEISLVETVVEKIGRAILKRFSLIRNVDVEVFKTTIPVEVVRGARISIRKAFHRES